jgi:hypothetical protein
VVQIKRLVPDRRRLKRADSGPRPDGRNAQGSGRKRLPGRHGDSGQVVIGQPGVADLEQIAFFGIVLTSQTRAVLSVNLPVDRRSASPSKRSDTEMDH